MKKWNIFYIALSITITALIFSGCSKDEDTDAPVITLSGTSPMEIELQQSYIEPGATAVDGEDGSVNVTITGSVDNDLKGTYIITYSATDEAGNTASVERNVIVVNSADFLGGNYVNAVDTCAITGNASFNATVSTSNTINGRFNVSNFGAFGTSVSVACDYNSATNKITAATPQSLGGGSNLTTVFSSSAVTSTTPVIFKISYQWLDSSGTTDICTSTYSK
jgi:hypothetical protein